MTGLILSALFSFHSLRAQQDTTDLLSLLGPDEPITMYTYATFKSTRVINLHSVENPAAGVMDFRISHRFGTINSGANNLYGLDQAYMRLGFEFGITDKLMAGFGRSNVNKEVDGFIKYKILRQSSGAKTMPVTLSYMASMVVRTGEWPEPDRKNYFTSRLYYCHQLIIGRKFNESLSLQLSPSLVHRNLIADSTIKNDVYALGAGGRYKLTKRTSFNAEYVYVPSGQMDPMYKNSLSLGFDIETGGHVFQVHFTNSKPMNDKGFITETTGEWSKGDIQFGFNVSRVFTVIRKRSPEEP
ncbi:MAG: hypothetical protein IPP69_02155 [Flavobacteriales bacterium]|nr:hypothetical protein [Flavobacteriales bacterium]